MTEERPRHFLRLLLSLVALGAFYPLLELSLAGVGEYIWTATFWLVLYQSSRVLHGSTTARRLGIASAALAFGLGLFALPMTESGAQWQLIVRCSAHVAAAWFLAMTTAIIIADVVGPHRVDADKIWGAVCVYILMGLTWAHLFGLAWLLDPAALVPNNMDPAVQTSDSLAAPLYFSFVTLTTLGYGDVVPGNAFTRLLAPVEAIAGQLYLTILVARLVGLHISHGRVADPNE